MYRFKNVLGVTLALGLAAPALATEEEEEGPGVPHIVVINNEGTLELEFDGVLPVDINGVPTVTVFLPNFNEFANEFTSNPLGGLADGFLNDDNGFESEGLPTGSNFVVTLTDAESLEANGFFLSLGAELISGTGDSFTLGDAFDDHPIFGLESNNPNFVGSASLVFDITDTTGAVSGTEQFGVILTTDPALATVPEPSSLALLGLAGFAAVARRRRR